MADRTDMDLDALLISALYGELAPADEARLAAHLASHPADQTALAELAGTRDAVRETRILAVQLDPPPSVSAQLLHEAARWSPKKAASRHAETAGWFHRFTRAFVAHPAMAMAATFVLVVGVAGTLYVRRGERVGEPTATVAASEPRSSEPTGAPVAAPAGAPVAAPARPDEQAGSAYGAMVDESKAAGAVREKQAPAASPAPQPPLSRSPVPPANAKVAKRAGISGIELRHPEPEPKDFDEDSAVDGKRDRPAATTDDRPSEPTRRLEAMSEDKPRVVRATGPGAAVTVAAPQQPRNAPGSADASGDLAGGAPAKRPAASDGRFASKAGGPSKLSKSKLASEQAADDQALLGWAQKQHELVVALVKSSKCPAAATVATEIYSRTPSYYAANVANDRSVKPCLSYLNSEREREDRRLAAKRATSGDAAESAPPAVAPVPVRAADKPGPSTK